MSNLFTLAPVGAYWLERDYPLTTMRAQPGRLALAPVAAAAPVQHSAPVQQSAPAPRPTPPPAAPTELTREERAAAGAELHRFQQQFGMEHGTRWFSEGKTFDEALQLQTHRFRNLQPNLARFAAGIRFKKLRP